MFVALVILLRLSSTISFNLPLDHIQNRTLRTEEVNEFHYIMLPTVVTILNKLF